MTLAGHMTDPLLLGGNRRKLGMKLEQQRIHVYKPGWGLYFLPELIETKGRQAFIASFVSGVLLHVNAFATIFTEAYSIFC